MSEPALSIVIPVYNREKLVVRCLDSVFAQTYRPLHIVVADNNSTDKSLEAVTAWAGKHESEDFRVTIVSEIRPGAAAARNRGLVEVETEWVSFFDSDDEMNPDMAQSIMSAATHKNESGQLPDVVLWRSAYQNTDGSLSPKPFSRRNFLRRQIINAIFSTQTFAVRTDFIRRCGGWNPDLQGWNDWELGIRLLIAGPVVTTIPRILCRIHPQQISITGLDFNSKHGIWEKSIDTAEKECEALEHSRQDEAKRLLLYRRVILAAHYSRERHPDFGRKLLYKSLSSAKTSGWRKYLLKFIYHYTRLGGRAAYILWH